MARLKTSGGLGCGRVNVLPDWDSTSNGVLKFFFDSASNKLQVFINVTNIADGSIYLYGFDTDNNQSTGGNIVGTDLAVGLVGH